MNKKKTKWIVPFLIMAVIVPLVVAWSGPPPADIVYYGYAYVNGSPVPAGATVQILANGGSLVMDSDTTIAGGYFPNLQMNWDDPDTGGDEGVTYANNAENIYFKINGQTTTSPASVTVTTSQAGQSIEINLSYIYNFPPVLDFISNQTFTEDTLKCFNITASDNTAYRTDTLTYSDGGAPLTLTKLNNTLAQACWTPTNSQVGNHTYTYSVTDDGTPQESDSQNVGIEVINVNDAPYINLADKTTLVNETFAYDVSAVSGDIDPTGDTLNYTDNTSLFDIGVNTGLINFTPTSTGVYDVEITVTDNWGASSSDVFTLTVIAEEKVIIRKNIYYETTSNGLVYTVTNKIYNFLGSDLSNVRFVDPDIGYNGTVNITDEKSVVVSGNLTIPETGQPFLFNQSTLDVSGDTYYSNQPRILASGVATTTTSGGGGGSSSTTTVRTVCEPCPIQEPCPEPVPCAPSEQPPSELGELPSLPPAEEKKTNYLPAMGISGLLLLIIIALIIRWLYLKYSIKKNLKFVLKRGNHYHFMYKNQRFSARVLNPVNLNSYVYTKLKNKEFIHKVTLSEPKSRRQYSFKAFKKLKTFPLKTKMILKRMQKIIKEKSLKTPAELKR